MVIQAYVYNPRQALRSHLTMYRPSPPRKNSLRLRNFVALLCEKLEVTIKICSLVKFVREPVYRPDEALESLDPHRGVGEIMGLVFHLFYFMHSKQDVGPSYSNFLSKYLSLFKCNHFFAF